MTKSNTGTGAGNLQSSDWRLRLIGMPRYPKRFLLILNDLVLVSLSLWLAFSLRLNVPYVPESFEFGLMLATAPLIAVGTFFWLGLYKLVTRYISPLGTTRIFAAVWLSVMMWALVVLLAQVPGTLPRTVVLMYGLFSTAFIWASRQFAGWILRGIPNITPARFEDEPEPVLIYGAGAIGVQLAQSLKRSGGYKLVGFIDENRTLWGQYVDGVRVFRPTRTSALIQRYHVREVFMAMPDVSRKRRRTIIKRLEVFPVLVKTLPSMEDIASGKVEVSDLHHVGAEDLLGRDPVPPEPSLLASAISGKNVLVTGAGGSIGSELTRQILNLAPRRLVLMDVSESALYEIHKELSQNQKASAQQDVRDVKLVALLGSVQDEATVNALLSLHAIQTIYHAAAYKHVPIVEENPVVGLRNNTFGTQILANAARANGVERFVLVSTDKAVRPTNVMGASKRLAELILQAEARKAGGTVFTMVRFGNVLDSSGSVVRLFRQQIQKGGPVTVTHPEVIRYFMSIPEAAQLVIQAGAMGRGGDVFVLDMGTPIKILDLATSMIRLMGLTVRTSDNPNGDIEITYSGLRPGEKLYEELLIGDRTTPTAHPRIKRNEEPFLEPDALAEVLGRLGRAMGEGDRDAIQSVLMQTVEGYQPGPVLQHAPTVAEHTDQMATVSGRQPNRTLH